MIIPVVKVVAGGAIVDDVFRLIVAQIWSKRETAGDRRAQIAANVTGERREDVLVYTSRPLENDLEVTGPIEVVLYAASSTRDTDFVVKLVDVFPAGRALNLSDGIIRSRYRNGYDRVELLEPGEAAI